MTERPILRDGENTSRAESWPFQALVRRPEAGMLSFRQRIFSLALGAFIAFCGGAGARAAGLSPGAHAALRPAVTPCVVAPSEPAGAFGRAATWRTCDGKFFARFYYGASGAVYVQTSASTGGDRAAGLLRAHKPFGGCRRHFQMNRQRSLHVRLGIQWSRRCRGRCGGQHLRGR